MVKRKIRALVVMAFGVALAAFSALNGSTQCAELAMLQDAMRELRRTDNLEFSYENTIAGAGVSRGEKTVVWADALSGSWVSEHYITDEDGTRRYLKKFCDGGSVYQYAEWSGEWLLSEDGEHRDSIFCAASRPFRMTRTTFTISAWSSGQRFGSCPISLRRNILSGRTGSAQRRSRNITRATGKNRPPRRR